MPTAHNIENRETARDELSFLFLQFQRTLVLGALSVYLRFDKRLKRNINIKIGPHILDIEDENQIEEYLKFLRTLERRFFVRVASGIHRKLDRSRRLKDFSITILLYLRLLFKVLRPGSIYGPYSAWVKKFDSPTDQELSQWVQSFNQLSGKAFLSVVVLPEACSRPLDIIQSIQTQKGFKVRWTLLGAADQNLRIKAEQLKETIENEDVNFISEKNLTKNLNFILASAHDWVVFQNEPGQFSTRSVNAFLNVLTTHKFDIAYGDADFLEKDASRFHPKFHPDWNLRYFVGQNCFRGLCFVSKEKLAQALQDHKYQTWSELLSYLVLSTEESKIYHISKILFHTRKRQDPNYLGIMESLSKGIESKFGAKLEINSNLIARILWPLPANLPKVSILIPTKDRVDLVRTLVDGLLNKTDYSNLEIVIVDNQSFKEESFDYFREIQKNPIVKVVQYDFPFNYSAINNYGFKYCTGEVLALLNNDMEIINPQWLKEAVREVYAPGVGIVGAKLYFKNGFIQHAGVALGSGQVPGHIHGLEHRSSSGFCNRLLFPHQLSAVTGACMVMKREVFAKVNGFNEKDLAVAYNDIDLCLRVGELGLKIIWTPFTELYHLESASRPPDRGSEQIVRYRKEVQFMRRRWRGIMNNDPYYNSNLTREKCNFMVPTPE
jgi:GT2 family glycosyltransferase